MQLSQVERERSGLMQLLILVIIACLGTISYLAYSNTHTEVVPVLSLAALGGCLYAIGRERSLKRLHSQLTRELLEREADVDRLGGALRTEQSVRAQEQGLTTQLEQRLRELSSLYRALSAVNATSGPEQTFQAVVRSALELVGGDCGSVMLLEGKDLVIVGAVGLPDDVIEQTRQPIGDGVAGWVVEHDEPVLLRGRLEDDHRFSHLSDHEGVVNYAMCVPLRLHGTVTGALNLGSSKPESLVSFSEYELSLATIFSQHASVAIQNAQLVAAADQLVLVG